MPLCKKKNNEGRKALLLLVLFISFFFSFDKNCILFCHFIKVESFVVIIRILCFISTPTHMKEIIINMCNLFFFFFIF